MSAFWIRIDRDVISVSGSDARTYLQSQLSQDLSAMLLGNSLASFILQPTGKIEALVRVHFEGDDFFTLDVDHGWGDAVMARLQRFKIRVKADMTLETRSCIAYRNLAGEKIEHALPAWKGDGSACDVIEATVEPVTGIRQGTRAEYDEERVKIGWPVMGQDLRTDMIPGETGIIDYAVSFTKGCYPGQELVERMDSRGSIAPKMLRVIHATNDARVGGDVIVDDVIVGTYTSVAEKFAIALIKRGTDISKLER
ncbi:MAG: hypothetical protein ABI570_03180 [Ilumatobacteraceae bacterium]